MEAQDGEAPGWGEQDPEWFSREQGPEQMVPEPPLELGLHPSA